MHEPVLATDQEASEGELWQRLRSRGDPEARQALIEMHLPYARIIAATCYARRIHDDVEFGDYLQLASVAMVECVDRYEPDAGAQFRTFASRRMQGAILSGLERLTERQQQMAVRQRLLRERLQCAKEAAAGAVQRRAEQVSAEQQLFAYLAEVGIGLALGVLLEETGMVDRDAAGVASEPEQHYRQVEMSQLKRRIAELVDTLPNPQRSVLQWHYLQDVSFTDIADRLDLTRGRVSQLHRQALESLRSALARGQGCDLSC